MSETLSPNDLRAFVGACYEAVGLNETASALVADSLVQADLWGHQSHGVMRTFWYIARIVSGAMDANAVPELDGGMGAIATMNGHRAPGQVVAKAAMLHAISLSKTHGIGAVAVRNSGHFGTAMYYTKMAAEAGCVGFVSSNASPAMAPWGGTEKRVGTNPWSWAAPAGERPPMMLDFANTAVARGKLYLARQRAENIPDTWAMDADGNATIDPVQGIAGTILPMAGHKGYAMATIVDMLSGVLTGSAFGSAVVGPYTPEGTSGAGHLVLAINISACRPLAEFNADMETLIQELKDTPLRPGVEAIYYPGEREALSAQKLMVEGLTLPEDTLAGLRAQAKDLGVALKI